MGTPLGKLKGIYMYRYRDPQPEILKVQTEKLDQIPPLLEENFGIKMKKNTPFFESTLENREEGAAKLKEYIERLNPW